ncbi:unnamed protein product [Eruca vesicaria subsp. sativa]|uniref:Uncharacterized protein n=1 Tax=Eruca vesicaria subsp. sativa TaxID=29727 RepID=A0ABC8J6S6_ERUVS|nr:unnamed protein product [Eruca vesicaria subsp. sativa]
MRESDLVDYFVPLGKRLAAGEWFAARVSTCGLFHVAYQGCADVLKTELQSSYSQLCKDDMPMMVFALSYYMCSSFGNVVHRHREHDQDSVRMLVVESCAALGKLLKPRKKLSSDSSQHVHSAPASVIMGIAPILRKHLVPIFLSLLKDEFPDVRLNIIRKLDEVNQVTGIDLLSQSLLPAIVELAEDRHWRFRLAIIEYVPLLASQLGIGFFDNKLGALSMQWLQDKVHLEESFDVWHNFSSILYSIHEAAANNLKRLAEEFGPEWAMQNLVPQSLVCKIANINIRVLAQVHQTLTYCLVDYGDKGLEKPTVWPYIQCCDQTISFSNTSMFVWQVVEKTLR